MEVQPRIYPTYRHPLFIPVCQRHGRMRAYSHEGKIAYFACENPDCGERGKAPMVDYAPQANGPPSTATR